VKRLERAYGALENSFSGIAWVEDLPAGGRPLTWASQAAIAAAASGKGRISAHFGDFRGERNSRPKQADFPARSR